MDNTEKFTGLAEEYRAGRPAYADEFVESLYSEQGFSECSVIADIGSAVEAIRIPDFQRTLLIS